MVTSPSPQLSFYVLWVLSNGPMISRQCFFYSLVTVQANPLLEIFKPSIPGFKAALSLALLSSNFFSALSSGHNYKVLSLF